AAVVGFAAGRGTGPAAAPTLAAPAPPPDTTLHSYLLLLEEPSWPPPARLARPGYREWASVLAGQGRYGGARKLTEEPGFRVERDGRVVRPDGVRRSPNFSGWYIVLAASYDEAIAEVSRGPHLRYGSVLVRQIEQ
ncbi:MAG: hypothetical protein HOP28_00210, partial [Gemmatimonadales bacterium]|nr:hypothetical protein [Gemmatimonadales bacterium]